MQFKRGQSTLSLDHALRKSDRRNRFYFWIFEWLSRGRWWIYHHSVTDTALSSRYTQYSGNLIGSDHTGLHQRRIFGRTSWQSAVGSCIAIHDRQHIWFIGWTANRQTPQSGNNTTAICMACTIRCSEYAAQRQRTGALKN